MFWVRVSIAYFPRGSSVLHGNRIRDKKVGLIRCSFFPVDPNFSSKSKNDSRGPKSGSRPTLLILSPSLLFLPKSKKGSPSLPPPQHYSPSQSSVKPNHTEPSRSAKHMRHASAHFRSQSSQSPNPQKATPGLGGTGASTPAPNPRPRLPARPLGPGASSERSSEKCQSVPGDQFLVVLPVRFP